MGRTFRKLMVVILGLGLLAAISSSAWAGECKKGKKGKGKAKEEKVALDKVPAAVKATILKQAGKNKIQEIEKVTHGKRVFYEAEWTKGDKTIEITVSRKGKLLKREVEREDDEKEEKKKADKDDDEDDEDEDEDDDEDDDDEDDD